MCIATVADLARSPVKWIYPTVLVVYGILGQNTWIGIIGTQCCGSGMFITDPDPKMVSCGHGEAGLL
jgi:hypothetical protein